MCGRYSLHHQPREVADRFDADPTLDFEPRFNVAPSQGILAVLPGRRLDVLGWGLVPHWTRDIEAAGRPISARAETVAQKPTFRDALRWGRCLIPASGFYEWKKQGRSKQPYFIRRRDRGVFAFAGLSARWEGPDGAKLRTACIVTTSPNGLMASIHDRMPVILEQGDEAAWLDVGGVRGEDALDLLRPYPEEELEAFPVSPRVNSPANDGPACIEPWRGPVHDSDPLLPLFRPPRWSA
jgi:putative SOS response-associated peptidase YedK